MKNAMLIALASALVTTGVLKASPALAEAPGAPTAVNVSVVRTADLDLRTPDGRRKLEQRLANAAREVCGTASDVDLEGKQAVRKCRAETLARAKAQGESAIASRKVIAVTATR